jgi:NAD(P)-dependent dehydrogenase (short-subunit alcohol dehydrogenase family)
MIPNQEGVLVTGCSSGIGRAVAIHLAENGFTVFATVRKQADADRLAELENPNLVPICPLDLTRPEQIPAVLATVQAELARKGKQGLYAIVNNAGGSMVAPIELMDLEKYHVELQTRLLGPVALLQAFLPLIRQAPGGRIVWIQTPALLPIPYVTSIHACDFAANCLARSLEIELKPWRIPNVLVRCGGINTPAATRSMQDLDQAFSQWPKERIDLYRAALEKEIASLGKFDEGRTDPVEVGKVVCTALKAARPRSRYQVGHMSNFAAFAELFPQSWVDALMARR